MPKDLKFVFQSKEQIHDSQYQDISRYDFTTPDGEPKSFEIHELGGTSVILALTPDNQVVTVTQYCPGPQQVLTELPAGFVDPGETPLQAAQRELLKKLDTQGKWNTSLLPWSTPTQQLSITSIARNCQKIAEQDLDPSEFTKFDSCN